MIRLVNKWYQRHFADPQVAILALLLILGSTVILLAGDILTPILAAIVIAYLLDGAVHRLRVLKVPRFISIIITFSVFIFLVLISLIILAPLIVRQAIQFMREIPSMLAQGQATIMQLPEKYPTIVSEKQIGDIMTRIQSQVADISQKVVEFSFASVVDLLSFMVYLVVVPLLVFFFLKDKEKIIVWFTNFMPRDRALVTTVWDEVNGKIAGYVRGKFMEILIIWVITYISFLFIGIDYALLLSFVVGISVLIPYVGAALVTVPVAMVAYFQWGYSSEMMYALIVYGIIQFLDGNLLVPLLFSEMVNIHPAAIIGAVLIFGGLWGIWGVFFAIPLATVIHAVINAWPRLNHDG
ncbi:MAG TPA: AI-2E family transporter [Leucothrix mucor]|uniref:AI-2E family transporter n=1 Tax=Leucothrix mucor TaxID=45248 RepID=A0A7V2T0R5_LEUMU|nr:AI-2E family transporter [Leucothrix mucor]